ncbi:transporter [Paucihalobacter ruber]|uniref:Transporter n=1 Tax=Paucihalobacter ruber TaxID=2567861 RepID=A0A506PNL7_9FLAO|nr:transporter [Paucihalobacter ruber]TPV34882.1 transporter [Paucihalobacter ruber]
MNKIINGGFLLLSLVVNAQFGRIYINAPRGSGALAATYSNTGSNTSWDEAISNDLFQSRINNINFNYTHVLRILDRTVGLGLNLPMGNILSYNIAARQVFNSASGMADPSIIFDMNIFGAASMLPEVFKETPAEDYFGIHTTWSLPLGEYDPGKQTNLGSNRFTAKILLNYGVPLKSGKNWIDLYTSIRFFGKNNNFFGQQPGQILSQKPLLGFEGHYTHGIANRTWIGGGLIYGIGGRQEWDTTPTIQAQNSLRYVLQASFPAWPGGTCYVGYNRTIFAPSNSADVQTFTLQYIHFIQYKNVKSYKKDPIK